MLDYLEKAMRTAAPTKHPDLLHAAIGLCTETIEMDTAGSPENYLEELGDTLWYTALGCRALGVTLAEAEEAALREGLCELAIAGDFMDLMKREMFYGKPADPQKQVQLLGDMIVVLRDSAEGTGSSLEAQMEANIAKLSKRYPDKFSEKRAINR